MQKDLRSLNLFDLEALLAEWGEPRFRAKQIYEWLWAKSVSGIDDMSNVSKDLRTKLKENFTFHTLFEDAVQHSNDGTIKTRFLTHDGHRIESVLIPVPSDDRFTVCVSTQVGCSLTCSFCATGRMGHMLIEAVLASEDCVLAGALDRPDSSQLGQDAAGVMLIYRGDRYKGPEDEDTGEAEIIIAKQRNGPVGTVKLAFISDYTRFENLERGGGDY